MTITKRYALQLHGRKRLELRRNTATGETAVVFDGRELGRVPRAVMFEGIDFALPDESLLHIVTEMGPRGVPFLYVTRNGHPLPGSEGDPVKILWLTCSIFWCLAALQIFFAAMVIRHGNPDGSVYAIGAAGLALVLLGVFSWRRSHAATVLASLIVFVELVLFFFFEGHRDPDTLFSALVGLSILSWLLMRGINAVAEINSHTLPVRHPPERLRRA